MQMFLTLRLREREHKELKGGNMKEDNEKIWVSVICLVYNHEAYLRKCLNGIVEQKTNFRYEILVHDDKSSDNSCEIIREYVEKYPELFVPIFEEENQFCKHGIEYMIENIILPRAQGEFIAFCEGDDFWCDNKKLQLQYDYMITHSNCSICLHNTKVHYLNKQKSKMFNSWNDIHRLTAEEVFRGGFVHTSSFFIRREAVFFPEKNSNCPYGDYMLLTWSYHCGEAVVLPRVMSVYNSGVSGGVMDSERKSLELQIRNIKSQIDYLQGYNRLTDFMYSDVIEKMIRMLDFNNFKAVNLDIMTHGDKKSAIKAAKVIKRHPCYKLYLKTSRKETIKQRMEDLIKYHGYHFYWLWRKALRLREKRIAEFGVDKIGISAKNDR